MPGPYFPDPAAEAIRDPAFSSSGYVEDENGGVLEMLKYLIANTGGRVHVGPNLYSPGTDWWVHGWAAAAIQPVANEYGWTGTAAAFAAGGAGGLGDFLATADPALSTAVFDADAAGDSIVSGTLLGGEAHLRMFESFMGVVPSRMCVEWWGEWEVSSNNEVGTGWGLSTTTGYTTGTDIHIYSNGANFMLHAGLNGGGATDTGAAIDNDLHKFKIVVDRDADTIEWFIDDVSQGTLALAANVSDVWPLRWLDVVLASTGANFHQTYGPWHLWYEE